MFRIIASSLLLVVLSGCISTPNTKALVTPLGGIGVHSFAPAETNPDTMPPPDVNTRVAKLFTECENRACAANNE